MRYLNEIKKVGIRDWIWFVFYLKRDEFSPKLDSNRYSPDNISKLIHDRNRADRIGKAINS